MGSGAFRPQWGAGRSPAAFSMGSRERSGREPMPVLPNPMDEVHGGIFIRFAEFLVRCLCFHFSPYVVHAVSENHFKLGTWAVAIMLYPDGGAPIRLLGM